ncbi:hypothetical protein Tco_1439630 [Tanacetum coccineum]
MRLETTVPQKEETFQVIIDVIKKSACFKAFTISVDVPEIFMQQFWYTIKKVQGTNSYEFLLANKKYIVDAEVFRKILDICPRVEGPLHKYTNMYVDYMSQPWRTLAAIINKILSGKTASNDRLRKSRIDIMWGMFYRENDDDIVSKLKFVRIGEDYQKYGLEILDVMLNDTIKRSKSYQMFIKYSTGQIPPKKSRGKGLQGKKTVDDSQETVDVSEKSKPEPVKKKTASRRVVKKKVTLSANDNIITDDPDVALQLGKSISLIEVKEAEAARKVHATHARIVTESVPESAKKKYGGRSSRGVTIQDTPSAPNPKPATSKPKLKGAQSLTPAEKEAADIMQALKESKKTSKRQPGTGGSSEETGTIPGVPDESTVISATLSEGTGTKPGVPDEEKDITKENVILEWGSEQESEYSEEDQLDDEEKDDKEGDADDEGDAHISNTQDIDDEDDETESDEDEIYKYKICVRKDEDEEILNDEVKDSRKGDADVSDGAKADAEKTEEAKDDLKKAKLPLTSSSLSVSSGFGDQFLKLSFDTSLVGTVKDTTDAEISLLLDIKIQSEVLHIQSLSVLRVLLRVAKLEKDVSELKNIDHSAATIATLKSQVPTVVDDYLGSKLGDALQKALQKHSKDLIHKHFVKPTPESSKIKTPIINLEKGSKNSASEILKIKREQAEKQKTLKFTIKSIDKASLKEYDQKSALYPTMHANKKHDDDEVDDDEDLPAGPNQGSKTGKSASAKEPVKEPTTEVVMDDAGEDVVRDNDKPQDTSEPMTTKTLNPNWFTQPPRPPTPDPE